MMDKIEGKKPNKLPFADIRKVADLTYFDGPLLSLFRDFDDQNYIYHWCDSDDLCNRWLVFQITGQQLNRYISQGSTLHEVITKPVKNETYVVDIDGEGNHLSIFLTQPNLLPNDYLPREGTLFDPDALVVYEQDIWGEYFTVLHDEIQSLRQAQRSHLQYNTAQLTASNGEKRERPQFVDTELNHDMLVNLVDQNILKYNVNGKHQLSN